MSITNLEKGYYNQTLTVMCFLQSVNLVYHNIGGHYFFLSLKKYLDHQAHDSDLG